MVAANVSIGFGGTFSSGVLDCFQHVEVFDFEDFSQLGIGDQSRVRDRCATVQASKDIRVVNQNVTDCFRDNHRVRLETARLELNRASQTTNIDNRGRVGVVIPVSDFNVGVVGSVSNTIPVRTPDVIREEVGHEVFLAVDQHVVRQHLSAHRTDFQCCIFVCECLLIEVCCQTEDISKVAVVGERHTNTLRASARSKQVTLAGTVEVLTVVSVILVRLLRHVNGREDLISDEVFLRLQVREGEIGQRGINMHLRRSEHRH